MQKKKKWRLKLNMSNEGLVIIIFFMIVYVIYAYWKWNKK